MAWTPPGLRSSKHQKTPRGESTPRRPGTGVFWPGTRIRAARRSPASAGRRRGLEKRTEDTNGPGGGTGKSGERRRRCPGASVTREMQPRPKGARGTRPEPARLRPLRWWGRGAPRPRPRAHLVVSRPVHSLVTPRETGARTHQEMPAGTPGAVLPARNTARGGRCPARGRGTQRAACPCGARRGPLPRTAGDAAGWLGCPPMRVAAERGRAQVGPRWGEAGGARGALPRGASWCGAHPVAARLERMAPRERGDDRAARDESPGIGRHAGRAERETASHPGDGPRPGRPRPVWALAAPPVPGPAWRRGGLRLPARPGPHASDRAPRRPQPRGRSQAL